MSEHLELPHELLLRRYGLSISQLSSHTQQMKRDLDKTLTLIVNKSKNGVVNITPTTQSKIETYDRYICDGIFEFLEDNETITEQQSDSLENQMDSKRDDLVNKMNQSNSSTTSNSTNTANTNTNATQQQSTPSSDEQKAKIGFWDWQ